MPARWSHSCWTTRAWKPVDLALGSRCRAGRSPRSAAASSAAPRPRRPGTDRQPSQPSSVSSAERRQHRIDELGVRHRLGVRIARVVLDAEDHDLQRHADLRRGEPGAVRRGHRVAQVGQQRVELGGAERGRPAPTAAAGAGRPSAGRRGSSPARPAAQTFGSDVVEQRRTFSMPASRTSAMPSIEISTARVAAAGGMVDDDADRRIRQLELARERGLGHAGHADQRGAVALHPVDFGGGFEARPRYRAVDAAVGEGDARRRRRGQAVRAQRRRVRMGEVDVDDLAVAAVEERRRRDRGCSRSAGAAAPDRPAGASRMPPTDATASTAVAPRSFSAHRLAR